MPTTTAEPLAKLTAHDRCDRCGARAQTRVRLRSTLELLFCTHHYTANSEALSEHVTDKLEAEESTA